MADTTVNSKVQIEVGVSGDASVKSIKTELREAKAEAINMARQFGENSTEATRAAEKVAKLKDEIEDLGLKIKGVNPDKFQRLADLGSGIANGFAAAQGAMALFGTESKDLEKTMVKLQGAIALSQGLQGLKDMKLMFSGLGEVAVSSLNKIKIALGETGLGLAIIAASALITTLISKWQDHTEQIKLNTEALQKNSDEIDIINEGLQQYSITLQDNTSDIIENAKAHTTLDEAIAKIQKEGLNEYVKDLKEFDKEKKKSIDSDFENRKIAIELMKDGLEKELALQKLNADKRADEYRRAGKQINNLEALNKKERDDIIKKYDDIELQRKIDAATNLQNANSKIAENDRKDADAQAEYHKKLQDDFIANLWKEQDEKAKALDAEEQRKKKNLENEKEYRDLQVKLALQGLQAIEDLTIAFGTTSEKNAKKAFEINKALQIAQAVISTIASAQAGFEAGMKNKWAAELGLSLPLAIFNATTATAAGLANIAKIKSTQFQSSTTPSTTQSSIQAPNISQPIEQQRQIVGTQTGATGVIQQSNTTKVIVTETDITRVQNRTKDIQRRAIVR